MWSIGPMEEMVEREGGRVKMREGKGKKREETERGKRKMNLSKCNPDYIASRDFHQNF